MRDPLDKCVVIASQQDADDEEAGVVAVLRKGVQPDCALDDCCSDGHSDDGQDRDPWTRAEHQRTEDRKYDGDTHLDDECPEGGVELGGVVFADEEDVLHDSAPMDRLSPRLIGPLVESERAVPDEIAKNRKSKRGQIRHVDAKDAARDEDAIALRLVVDGGQREDKAAEQKQAAAPASTEPAAATPTATAAPAQAGVTTG